MTDDLSFGLKGKTVLVTGATGSIGSSVAKGFANGRVSCCCRRY